MQKERKIYVLLLYYLDDVRPITITVDLLKDEKYTFNINWV